MERTKLENVPTIEQIQTALENYASYYKGPMLDLDSSVTRQMVAAYLQGFLQEVRIEVLDHPAR
jgi:hypothetical protein